MDVLGEDKSEQTIAEMRADGRLTDQDRVIIYSWRPPGGGNDGTLADCLITAANGPT
jgi:hypothetical protein